MNRSKDNFFNPFTAIEVSFLNTIAIRMIEYGMTPEDMQPRSVLKMRELTADKDKLKTKVPVSVTKPKYGPWPKQGPLCPECESEIRIQRVNVSKCTNVGGDWKTSIMCKNPNCRFTELSKKTIEEIKQDGIR